LRQTERKREREREIVRTLAFIERRSTWADWPVHDLPGQVKDPQKTWQDSLAIFLTARQVLTLTL